MNYLPTITIVIPVKPGLKPEVLNAVKELDYPRELMEVYLVYGKNPSYQRNSVVKMAKGEVIYFLDNDSLPKKDTLKRLVKHLENPDVAIAGGPSIAPKKIDLFPFIFGKTLESVFCSGSSANRYKRSGKIRFSSEKEVILCNMVMKRQVFQKFGGLNEKLYPNEENELMEKVKHSGYKIVYDPDAYIERMPRKTLKTFIKQIFNYGRGRGEQTFFYPKSFSFINFIPFFFLIYLITAFIKRDVFLLPLFIYFVILIIDAAVKVIREKELRLIFLPITSFLLHIVYGIGTFYGLIKAPFKKAYKGKINIERVNL